MEAVLFVCGLLIGWAGKEIELALWRARNSE